MSKRNSSVALVYMPFGPSAYPPLGIALLQAALSAHGIACDAHYFNLTLAAQLGVRNYTLIAQTLTPAALLGEWLFSAARFGAHPHADAGYVNEILWREMGDYVTPIDALEILRVRERATQFVRDCFESVDWTQYQVVGLSVGYQQTCASLALARLIKTHHPDLPIVFGGANCAGEIGIGLARAFSEIDFVCIGEGDLVFPQLVRALVNGARTDAIPGIASRASLAPAPAPSIALDALPYPDYRDYFAQCTARLPDAPTPVIPFEAARGCWWAQRKPCAFCSLVSPHTTFRCKSPARVVDEIQHLNKNYGARISVSDLAFAPEYLDTLLPELATRAPGIELYWETRVTLRREHFAQMARARVVSVQLGVESFSDALLKLIGKGTTALQNIQALKWCKQFGIRAAWNLLYGLPGEDPREYAALETLMPLLCHLPAPQDVAHVRFERFSAYLQNPGAYGITRVAPKPVYRFVYPDLSANDIARIAYYFDAECADASPTYLPGVTRLIEDWRARADAVLEVFASAQTIRIVDTRARGESVTREFGGLAAHLYRLCDSAQTPRALMELPAIRARATASEVSATLDEFVRQGLMICAGEQYLSLAVARAEHFDGQSKN